MSLIRTSIFAVIFTIIQGFATVQALDFEQHVEKLSVPLVNGPAKNSQPVKNFLGVNDLYFIDNDVAWTQHDLGQKLSQLGVTTLRYPGGEVADNYDWETNSPERVVNQDSGELAKSKDQNLDYLKFLQHASKMGAGELFFVVNVEGALLSSGNKDENILRYAKKAARWVSEVKRHGDKVKYWELGNESYLNSTSYPLSASEYAQAVNVFYREMKQADPSIKIGVVGPNRIGIPGFVDGLTPQQLAYFRQTADDGTGNNRNACQRNGKKGKECANLIKGSSPSDSETGKIRWWDTVLANAKNSFDFAVVHSYELEDKLLKQSKIIQEIHESLSENAGRPIELNITEWNVPPSRRVAINDEDIPLDTAVKLGNYLAAGVSHAIFWPLRYKEQDRRSILTFDSFNTTPTYKTLAFISPLLQGEFVNQLSLGQDVYFLQTQSTQGMFAMLVNRSQETKSVSMATNANVEIKQLDGLTGQTTSTLAKPISNNVEFQLPPKSITLTKATNP